LKAAVSVLRKFRVFRGAAKKRVEYPIIHSEMKPVPNGDPFTPVPPYHRKERSISDEEGSSTSSDSSYIGCQELHLLKQTELNDPALDLNLSKQQA
jgi:hypothetical protein